MRTLPKLLCAITLLSISGLVWASCPEGQKENDRNGSCEPIPGLLEKIEAEKKEKELKASLASLSPGKFVQYLDASWITKPMNTQEAIEYYLKGRKLDPIEGAWHNLHTENEIIIVKNNLGISPGDQYIGILTHRGSWMSAEYRKDEYANFLVGIVNGRWNQVGHHPLYNKIWLRSTETGFWRTYKHSWHYYPSKYALTEDGKVLRWVEGSIQYVKLYPTGNIEPDQQVAGSGTGFLVSSDGYIITNHHVIDGANKITVTTPSGESFKAEVVSTSFSTDLALLRIPYQTKNYLTFASPGSAGIGNKVFTLGYPISDMLGKEVKYTDGSISSLSGLEGDATFFQISVPVQPGNSGGPLVNEDGNVVGVVTAVAAVKVFYEATGTIPQNVNWAVKGAYASLLLPPTMETNERPKSNPIANAKWSVVFIETY